LSQILHQKNGQTLKNLGYVFDAADQITQISGAASNTPEDSVVAAANTNANNQYTNLDGQPVSHDANGNQVAQGPVSYQWDARDRLIGITGPGTTASFTYDALGRRAGRTTVQECSEAARLRATSQSVLLVVDISLRGIEHELVEGTLGEVEYVTGGHAKHLLELSPLGIAQDKHRLIRQYT
jgi:YD repeat-containing protein